MGSASATPEPVKKKRETAETMASRQKDIAVSEFFARIVISLALTILAKRC